MNQSMFSIAYTKSFEVNPNSIVTLTPNLTESFSTLPFFLWDTSVYKHCTWNIVRNLLIFLPHRPCMISRDLDKSHDFWDFACFFLEFKNHLATRSWSCFLNKMFEFFFHFPSFTTASMYDITRSWQISWFSYFVCFFLI